MSLPTTRFPLPHVGAARNQGSDPAPCADPKVGGLLRGRQFGHRPVRANDVPYLQRRHVPDLSQAIAPPANPWAPHDRRAGQCSISPCEAPGQLPSQQCSESESAFSAALQPSVGSNRARLEADSASRYSQPLLRHAGRSTARCPCLLRSLAATKQGAPSAMLHYLRRRV